MYNPWYTPKIQHETPWFLRIEQQGRPFAGVYYETLEELRQHKAELEQRFSDCEYTIEHLDSDGWNFYE